MSSIESNGTDEYLVNTLKGMNHSSAGDEHPLFHGHHNDYLANMKAKRKTSADRFVDIFFWLAVVSVVALISILIASIVLSSRSNRLVPFTSFPKAFTLSDGTILRAIVTQPLNTKVKRPVIFELTNKRLEDANFGSAWNIAADFASRGLIVVQVNSRGVGSNLDSQRPNFPLSRRDIDDGVQLVELLSKLSGSNGEVGVFGLGSSATLALLIAQESPPNLKTVVALHAAESEFWQDAFPDGNFQPNLYKALTEQLATLPAYPNYAIDPTYWQHRFNISVVEPYIFTYLNHQTFDPFWRTLNVNPDLHPIKIPVYLIGGIYNQHKDSSLELYAKLTKNGSPKVKVVLGPFGYNWPDEAPYGSRFAARVDVASWFKQWLSDEDNGFMREPDVSMYYRNPYKPGPSVFNIVNNEPGANPIPTDMTGSWKYEGWPIEREQTLTFSPAIGRQYTLDYNAAYGFDIGSAWGPVTGSQTQSDAESGNIFMEMAPLDEQVLINGFPTFSLRVQSPLSDFVSWHVRLEDVAPDGTVTLVTGCSLNEAMLVGEGGFPSNRSMSEDWFNLPGKMHYTTWAFQKGHKIRFSVTNSAPGMTWSSTKFFQTKVLTLDGSQTVNSTSILLPTVTTRVGRAARTPRFTNVVVAAKQVESPDGFPYNRTFAINKAVVVVNPTTTSWFEAEGTYVNSNDVLFIGFVGQNITVVQAAGNGNGNEMNYQSHATHIIIRGISEDTHDDPPGLPSVYLHDLLHDLQMQYSYDLNNINGVQTNLAKNSRSIPNLALTHHQWVQVSTSTTIHSDEAKFYVTATRDAKNGLMDLPTQIATRSFDRRGH
jgi:putative CocE/NonD family hydrolase